MQSSTLQQQAQRKIRKSVPRRPPSKGSCLRSEEVPSSTAELILVNIRFAHSLSKSLLISLRLPRSLEDDVLSAAYLGLCEAARNNRASTLEEFRKYARIRIRGSIIDFLRKNGFFSISAYRKMKEVLEKDPLSQPALMTFSEDDIVAKDNARSPEEVVSQWQISKMLQQLVVQLPEPEREVIQATYYQDRPMKELVEQGRGSSALSKLHKRAMARLKKQVLAAPFRLRAC